jgi:1,4-alpha-glucan branching enzyme
MDSRIMIMLHSHIPYVKRQGRWPFGEVWLFEAMAETYIPFLRSWFRFREEGLQTPVTLSFSPVLLEQLGSKYIRAEFISYLKEREASASQDERYYLSDGRRDLAQLARYYRDFYRDIRRDFLTEFDQDIPGAVKLLQNEGRIEIITTAATHAYLPLLDRKSLEYQIIVGKQCYEKYFECEARGFWLPECGYFEGIEDILIKHGFEYFYVDSHALEGGKPIGIFSGNGIGEAEIECFASTGLSTYRPYRVKDKDIMVLGRNAMVSHQVWSADYGYPGDKVYREFHRQSQRSGFKYWRVTDRSRSLDKKEVYDPDAAQARVKQQARHFVDILENTGREAQKIGFNSPLVVGCYDTELFGHWWWEGIDWLEQVFRGINDSALLNPVMPAQIGTPRHEAQIFESSWGMGGKHFVWRNEETAWMWDIIGKASREYEQMKNCRLDNQFAQRAIIQAFKELMLIESSDWMFMVTNNLTRDYAMKRFFEHYTKFLRLGECLRSGDLGMEFLDWLEKIEFEDDFMTWL